MLEHRTLASAELIAGYLLAADLADQRRRRALTLGKTGQAATWSKLAKYCQQMANTKAIDDDQYQFQRDQQRQRDALGSRVLSLDEVAGSLLDRMDQAHPKPSEWAILAIELVLTHLSPMQRSCYEMVEGRLMDANEVAKALDIPPNQVRHHVARARARVQSVWRKVEHLIPDQGIIDQESGDWHRSAG